ncbi:hypothetical protein [Dongia sedimenti]|uniref:Uncharacterized protein n=1 Tax=Dongia sedimenti TaxID=3064282 RepID=A0ABU0YFC7_9PROT|nr:hypothetical protein [Rhodospirillaceae bacterium R-7]
MNRQRRGYALTMAAILFAWGGDAYGKKLEHSDVYGWSVDAYGSDVGAFLGCNASTRQNGYLLGFLIDPGYNLELSLHSAAWPLREGEVYRIQYVVDDLPPVAISGSGSGQRNLFAPLTKVQLDAFLRGRQVTLKVVSETITFSLSGVTKAMVATLDCANRWAP